MQFDIELEVNATATYTHTFRVNAKTQDEAEQKAKNKAAKTVLADWEADSDYKEISAPSVQNVTVVKKERKQR